MPDTGFRSVSPRARTPIIDRMRAQARARRVRGMERRLEKEYCTAAMQMRRERRRVIVVVRVLIRCSGGASASSGRESLSGWSFQGVGVSGGLS
jgi:hypothetical protein